MTTITKSDPLLDIAQEIADLMNEAERARRTGDARQERERHLAARAREADLLRLITVVIE